MIENNRNHYRGKTEKNNAKITSSRRNNKLIGCPDYVIRADGTVLSEFLWKERRLQGKPYTFIDDSTIRALSSSFPHSQQHSLVRRSDTSLRKIESLIKKSVLEYGKIASFPAEPLDPKRSSASKPTAFPPRQQQQEQQHNHYENKIREYRGNPRQKNDTNENDQNLNTHQRQLNKKNDFATPAGDHSRKANPLQDDEYDDDVFEDFDVDQAVSQHQNSAFARNRTLGGDRNASSHTTIPAAHPASEAGILVDSGFNSGFSRRGIGNNINASDSRSSFVNSDYHQSSLNYQQEQAPHRDESTSFSSFNHSIPESNDDGDKVLCPEHGVPCRLLTANTSINFGRQFYKCSLPEGQSCDFFQWKDGMEGNWNSNSEMTGTSNDYNTGATLNMNVENRRVFGHRSFRRGQEEVIEKAIQGRDVFVLMPTGYVRLLAFIFVDFLDFNSSWIIVC